MDSGLLADLKAIGFLRQKEDGFFTVRVHLVAGNVSAQEMKTLSDIAEKYGRGFVGVTTRLNIEIPWIKLEDIENVKEELDNAHIVYGGTGMKVRTIVACKGTICPFGNIDTQKLCKTLDELYFGEKTPCKVKINITGCQNNCGKVKTCDIGIMGTKEGVKIYIGGKSGNELVAGADAGLCPENQVPEHIGKILDFYRKNAEGKERIADMLKRGIQIQV